MGSKNEEEGAGNIGGYNLAGIVPDSLKVRVL